MQFDFWRFRRFGRIRMQGERRNIPAGNFQCSHCRHPCRRRYFSRIFLPCLMISHSRRIEICLDGVCRCRLTKRQFLVNPEFERGQDFLTNNNFNFFSQNYCFFSQNILEYLSLTMSHKRYCGSVGRAAHS